MSGSAEIDDLNEQLKEYSVQLEQIQAALAEDETNADLLSVQKELLDVLELTRGLLKGLHDKQAKQAEQAKQAAASDVAAQQPQQVANFLAVGTECMAKWAKDEKFYKAKITQVHADDSFAVEFVGYNEAATTVPRAELRTMAEHAAAVADAREKEMLSDNSKRKRDAASKSDPYEQTPIPAYLQPKPTDSEKERESKRKRVKSIKNQNRKKRLAKEKAESAKAWQKFVKKKASAKSLTGFRSGKKSKKLRKTSATVAPSQPVARPSSAPRMKPASSFKPSLRPPPHS